MQGTVKRWATAVTQAGARRALTNVLAPLANRITTQTIATSALRIKGGSASAIVQTNAAYYALIDGKLVTKASATDIALSGTVANATFNVWAFTINIAGTITATQGGAATTLAAVKFPAIPEASACMGFVIINPTGTGTFTGGTTALDDATVAPNAVFINTVGLFDPTILN